MPSRGARRSTPRTAIYTQRSTGGGRRGPGVSSDAGPACDDVDPQDWPSRRAADPQDWPARPRAFEAAMARDAERVSWVPRLPPPEKPPGSDGTTSSWAVIDPFGNVLRDRFSSPQHAQQWSVMEGNSYVVPPGTPLPAPKHLRT